MTFDVAPRGETFEFSVGEVSSSAHETFVQGHGHEAADRNAAIASYARCVELDCAHAGAYANWGRLLHERGELAQAEDVYRRGLAHCAQDALLWFNLAVLLDEQGLPTAEEAYCHALACSPPLADAHYNLGLLYETAGRDQEAIRHFSAYRKLRSTSGDGQSSFND